MCWAVSLFHAKALVQSGAGLRCQLHLVLPIASRPSHPIPSHPIPTSSSHPPPQDLMYHVEGLLPVLRLLLLYCAVHGGVPKRHYENLR